MEALEGARPIDVEALLGPRGALAAEDPSFEDRPQQRRMAEAVARALESDGALVVEAGTGVGKSLAYLLPGAVWAASSGRRLLVSTHTRALQEQILEHDLPLAARALKRLGIALRYAMLQGAENYLCVQRLARLQRETPDLFDGAAALVDRIAQWARSAESGHRSGVPELIPQPLWSRLCREPDACLGPNGRLWGACLYRKDKERAERSHVLVVNHALLLSGARLPSYDALIIDEAHTLEESAASRFGVTVSKGRLSKLLEEGREAARRWPELSDLLKECAAETAGYLEAAAESHGLPPRAQESAARLLDASRLGDVPPSLARLESACLKLMEGAGEASGLSAEDAAALEAQLRLLQARAAAFRADVTSLSADAGEDSARWIERGAGGVEIKAQPLEVGGRLCDALFSRGIPVVLTSATLAGPGGLKEFKARVGLEGARELAVGSPFDYESQAALLMLDDLPDPSDDRKYIAALSRRCADIIGRVPGGLFLLFSSWKTLKSVHGRLKRKVKDRPLWMQGEAGNDALLEDFMSAGNAVLLGVDTFWQGIDVPGEALSCVVLVKLPFPNYGSPVEEARRRYFDAMGRDYFRDHSLARAVMKFRQGFGRLIRTTSDRGAVVVLDGRIVKKGYGAAFREALPRCKRLETLDDLSAFFAKPDPLKRDGNFIVE